MTIGPFWFNILMEFWDEPAKFTAHTGIDILGQKANVVGFDFESRCNVFATIQALLINKLVIDLIYLDANQHLFNSNLATDNPNVLFKTVVPKSLLDQTLTSKNTVWFVILFLSTVVIAVDLLATLTILPLRLEAHNNIFNWSYLVGKLILVAASWYLNGIIFYDNWLLSAYKFYLKYLA